MMSSKQIWPSLYPLLNDVCISREVSLGCIYIQVAHKTQESLILFPFLATSVTPCSLSLSAPVTLSSENLEHI